MPVRLPIGAAAMVSAAIFALFVARHDPTHDVPLPLGGAVIEDHALSELSGMEASPGHPGVFWGINDSGSLPRLYRFDADGRALGRVRLRGAWIRDSETLAIWRDARRAVDWVLIGDVGDNRGRRGTVRVHAVAEPAPGATVADIAWTLEFLYPDGPRDVEGIAVDHRERQLLVMSKRDLPARLYRVALDAASEAGPAVAEHIASLPVDRVDGEVTGLDLSKDGRRLAVLSYRGLYVWHRHDDEDWPEALARAPLELALPTLRKAEAMAFSHDSDAIFVGSEKRPTHLVRIALPPG